ncbi:MAG: NAD-dependent epimerase/dehydratase family protein [Candidatus Limnocylindrales bacterium]
MTGAAGFIGSRLARRLLDDGHSVIGVDAYTTTYNVAEKHARTAALMRNPRYTHVRGDLVDLPLEPLLERAEVVFHLAGRPGVRPSFDLGDLYRHDNVDATRRLLDACLKAPAVRRLVYASSSSVYGDAPLPFRETGVPAPISPYGQTKLEAERLCLAAAGDALETVALRYFTVYGPGQRPDMGLRRFAEAALAGRPIELLGDGTQSRDFTYVDDIVDATRRAADAPVAGLAVNVGGGSRITLLQIFALLEELLGRPVQIAAEPFARGDVRHTAADLTRARQLLGFEARIGFREGYGREVEWLRQAADASAA